MMPQSQSAARRYTRRFIVAMSAYVVLVMLSAFWMQRDLAPAVRVVVALLPVVPIVFLLRAFMVFLRTMDELQRQIQFQAFGFSLLATSMTSMTLGFLEVAGVPMPGLLWVFPMAVIYWRIGHWLAERHYA